MAIETDEDRAIFFDDDDFGVVASITPTDVQYQPSGDPFDVSGIYDAHSLTRGVKQDNGYSRQAEVQSGPPQFRARSSDLEGVRSGRAIVTIPPHPNLPAGGSFYVHDVQPDGTGTTVLVLKKG
jgi:hypothetical protein